MNPSAPERDYRQRLEHYRARHQLLEQRIDRLGLARVGLALVGAVVLVVVVFSLTAAQPYFSPWWLALPVVALLGVSVFFEQARRESATARRMMAFYELGLARLEDRWAGQGVAGTEYLREEHLYAADLDLFGSGSLFERLCEARTRVGRDALARWLLEPARAAEVRERQDAVRDLRDKLDWRERLTLAAGWASQGIDTKGLAEWGAEPVMPSSQLLPWVAKALVLTTAITITVVYVGWPPSPPLLIALFIALVLQMLFAMALRPRVERAIKGLRGRSRDLFRVGQILIGIEQTKFASPRMVRLQQALLTEGIPPSQRLAELVRLLELLDSTRNSLFGMVAPLLLWTTQVALGVEVWRRQTGPSLGRWLDVAGEAEALTSLAGYAFENPGDPFPEIVEGGPLVDAAGLGHPLLPRGRCVVNDVTLGDPTRLLIVSGSNMSGKSTFLRAIGINAVLAQMGAPVRAGRLRLSGLAVAATLRIQDSLQGGKSRFFAEITRLQKVVALATGPLPVLFLLDELLHGTNSHDRRIGAEAVLKTLLDRGAIGLVTTHDLSLAEVAERLAPVAANVHFSDDLVNGELHFDYRLRRGVVEHSNALALMRAVGLSIEELAPAR